MKLIIIESGNKIKTYKSVLHDQDVEVLATSGHIRELAIPDGYEIKNNKIHPKWKSICNKFFTSKLKEYSKKADQIILATDPDREGEAIAYAVMEYLGPKYNYKRADVHSITYGGIKSALENLRDINVGLVNAQLSRRLLDRMVGFIASDKCKKHLKEKKPTSAGRVQSVALRIVCDRESEIETFKSQEYYDLRSDFAVSSAGKSPPSQRGGRGRGRGKATNSTPRKMNSSSQVVENVKCILYKKKALTTENPLIFSKESMEKIAEYAKGQSYDMKIDEKINKKYAPPCFTTSAIQQSCSTKFHMNPSQTMSVLQKLFEEGHITYHRTDSVYIVKSAIDMARTIIEEKYGKKYVPAEPIFFKGKSAHSQEAHEAIRPTHPDRYPELKDADEAKVYRMIWERYISCQMIPMEEKIYMIDWEAKDITFQKTYSEMIEPGWKIVSTKTNSATETAAPKRGKKKVAEAAPEEEKETNDDDTNEPYPSWIKEYKSWNPKNVRLVTNETKPPYRYTQASLIRELEERGIGRPSTYAYIITKILTNRYVFAKGNLLFPTDWGKKLCGFLKEKYSSNFMDIEFTKNMEDTLDSISEGKTDYNKYVIDFHNNFIKI